MKHLLPHFSGVPYIMTSNTRIYAANASNFISAPPPWRRRRCALAKRSCKLQTPKRPIPSAARKTKAFLVAADPMRCHPFGLVASDQSLIHTFEKIPSKEHDVHPKKERYKISLQTRNLYTQLPFSHALPKLPNSLCTKFGKATSTAATTSHQRTVPMRTAWSDHLRLSSLLLFGVKKVHGDAAMRINLFLHLEVTTKQQLTFSQSHICFSIAKPVGNDPSQFGCSASSKAMFPHSTHSTQDQLNIKITSCQSFAGQGSTTFQVCFTFGQSHTKHEDIQSFCHTTSKLITGKPWKVEIAKGNQAWRLGQFFKKKRPLAEVRSPRVIQDLWLVILNF